MEEIIILMKEYSKRHSIKNGVTLILEDDSSGCISKYQYDENPLFEFRSIDELIEKLKV